MYILLYFFWGLRSFRESSFWGTSWLLFIMVALCYDNLILAVGSWIGAGETLEVLSLLRYLLKVFLTPTFVFIAWDILRRLHIEWAEYLSTRILFNFYTFFVTVFGVYTEILWITLEPVSHHGILLYLPNDHHIPLAIFLAILPLVLSGYYLWRKLRWPILGCGVLITICMGGVAIFYKSVIFASIAEFLLIVSLVITEWKQRHEDFHRTGLF